MKNLKSIQDWFTKEEIKKIDEIIEVDEKTRYEILEKCLSKKKIPQTQHSKFWECIAYFIHCELFDKYFEKEQVNELYDIGNNFR